MAFGCYEPNFVSNQTMKSIAKFRKMGLQTIKRIFDQYFVYQFQMVNYNINKWEALIRPGYICQYSQDC